MMMFSWIPWCGDLVLPRQLGQSELAITVTPPTKYLSAAVPTEPVQGIFLGLCSVLVLIGVYH